MKKKLSVIFVALLLIAICSFGVLNITASAETSYTEGYYTYTISNGKAEITDVSTSISGDVVIPSTLGGYPVTNIGTYAFENCTGLTSVTIGCSVTSIGWSAFSGCTGLTSVTIGNSVTSIGGYAFYNCTGLTSVTIPDSVTSIGSYAFVNCTGLNNITVSDSNTTYRSENNCIIEIATNTLVIGSNKSVIPNSVTSIGNYAFRNCTGLTSVTIPNSVTTIGWYAFLDCTGLTSVTIGNSVTSIGNGAFEGCNSLENITLPFVGNTLDGTSNTHFGYIFGASSDSYNYDYVPLSLSTVVITNAVSIDDDAFYNCSSLKNVIISDTVTSIGYYAFYNCNSLTSITLPFVGNTLDGTSNTHFGYIFGASVDFYNYDYVPSSLRTVVITKAVSIDDDAFYNCSSLKNVIISDTVTKIGGYAFKNCSSLTSVTIPDSVTSIGDNAFKDCGNLKNVYITDIAAWCNIDFENSWSNPLYYANNSYLNGELITDLVIPEGVTTIPAYAFSCNHITSVTIPDSVTSIGDYAFYNCSSLKNVYITDIAAWWNIDFKGSYSNPLFYAEKLYLNGELITDLAIPEGVTTIPAYAFSCNHITSVTIPDSVTSIGSLAFYSCTGLTSVTIPDGVTNIGEYAFYNCKGLTNIYYRGSEEDREEKLSIGSGNSSFTNATWYYDSCIGFAEHTYTNDCDTQCNVCEFLREGHVYDNTCDTTCNLCDYVRDITHTYDNDCDTKCNVCEQTRTTNGHMAFSFATSVETENSTYYPFALNDGVYSSTNKADGSSSTLTITALRDYTLKIEYYTSTEANYDKLIIKHNSTTRVTKSGSTSWEETTIDLVAGDVVTITYSKDGSQSSGSDAIYFKLNSSALVEVDSVEWSCEDEVICDICGEVAKAATEHTYDNACDTQCNVCNVSREAPHSFSGSIDETCNACDYTRVVDYDDFFDYTISNSEAEITDVSTSISGDVIIPSTLGGYPVTSIGGSAFYNCTGLTSVTIPDSVTSIGYRVFGDCTGLTNITIPDSVTSIGSSAFSGCTGLTSVTIPESVTNIGDYAFYNCTGLTSITIPESVTSIGSLAFSNCTRLNSITVCESNTTYRSENNCIIEIATNTLVIGSNNSVIPNSVTSIGDYAFYNCTGLTSVTIPEGVTSISDSAFSGCTGLETVDFNATNCTNTGLSYVFYGCTNLKTVNFGDNVTIIPAGAFYNCTGLTNIIIPDSVTSIGSSAFPGCTGLTNIIIPDSVTSIDSYAFYNCTGLTSVTIGCSVTSIGSSAFSGCTGLINIYYRGSEEDKSEKLSIGIGNSSFTNATWYYGSCIGTEEHTYDNICDCECNVCGGLREGHVYDNTCDTVCNLCYYVRNNAHTYDNACDTKCNVCEYVRTVPDHSYTHNGNHTCDICKYSKTPDKPTTESKTNSSVTLVKTEGFEYSKDGVTWQDSNVFTNLSANTTYTFYQRVKESQIAFESEISGGLSVTFKAAQTAPSAPVISSFTDTTVTLIPNANYEYSIDGTTWQTSNVFTGLSSGTKYTFYQRYAETDTHEASNKSNGTSIKTDKSKQTLIPNAPTVQSFNSNSITLTAVDGCEYSKDGNTWQSDNVFSGLSCGTEYTFYQRYQETITTYVGKSSEALITRTDKGTQTAPSAPILSSKTHNSVTLKEVSGYEYSRDGINWQTSNVFTALDPETNYMFYQRKSETDKYYAGLSSVSVIVKTSEAPECYYDISKHKYDNLCDTSCNTCGASRTITHTYEWVIDNQETCGVDGKKHEECTACHATRNENIIIDATGNHTYDNNSDTTCNICGTVAYPGGNTLVKENGVWYHIVNREKVSDTTLVQYNGTWYYVKNGKVDFSATTLVKYNNKWWYVKAGKMARDNTLVKYNNVWYHVNGGNITSSTTLVQYNGTWYYVKNGKVDFSATTLVKYNNKWWYVKAGKMARDNTLVKYNNVWYHVNGGNITSKTTLVQYNGTWYYVKNGKVDFTSNTLVNYNNQWYHVNGGKWVKDTTLVKYNNKWYYVSDGRVNFSYTGRVFYSGKYYNVKNGVKV